MQQVFLEHWSPPSITWRTRTKANMGAKVRIHVKDRVDVRPATTAAKAKTPAAARVAARLPRTAAKERMAVRLRDDFPMQTFFRFLFRLALSILAGGYLLFGMAKAQETSSSSMVKVRIIGPDGLLTEPVAVPRVQKTDAEWRKQLTAEQFEIARGQGTEPAFCGTLLDNHRDGIYHCVCCGLPLFASDSKFNSGTGWPSFFQPVAKENVLTRTDNSLGMRRLPKFSARDAEPTWGTCSTMVQLRPDCVSA